MMMARCRNQNTSYIDEECDPSVQRYLCLSLVLICFSLYRTLRQTWLEIIFFFLFLSFSFLSFPCAFQQRQNIDEKVCDMRAAKKSNTMNGVSATSPKTSNELAGWLSFPTAFRFELSRKSSPPGGPPEKSIMRDDSKLGQRFGNITGNRELPAGEADNQHDSTTCTKSLLAVVYGSHFFCMNLRFATFASPIPCYMYDK